MKPSKQFFFRNILITQELAKYAPTDDTLLSIPPNTSAFDPFLLFCLQIAEEDSQKNNTLIGANLHSFLQYTNQTLARLYAAHTLIIENRSKELPPNLPQPEIDYNVHVQSCILQEYSYSLREFISMLRTIVDQFILLLPPTLKNQQNCDCISKFLQSTAKEPSIHLWDENRKFLRVLNEAANYLKHHRYQFGGPTMVISPVPSLLVVISKNEPMTFGIKDFLSIFNIQPQQLICNNTISCWVDCDFLVREFNKFYKKFNPDILSQNKNA